MRVQYLSGGFLVREGYWQVIADSSSGVTVSLSCSTVASVSCTTDVLSCSEGAALVVVVIPLAPITMSISSSQSGKSDCSGSSVNRFLKWSWWRLIILTSCNWTLNDTGPKLSMVWPGNHVSPLPWFQRTLFHQQKTGALWNVWTVAFSAFQQLSALK